MQPNREMRKYNFLPIKNTFSYLAPVTVLIYFWYFQHFLEVQELQVSKSGAIKLCLVKSVSRESYLWTILEPDVTLFRAVAFELLFWEF